MSGVVLGNTEKDVSKIVFAVQQLTQGRSNAVGTCTLTPSATTTTVTAINCGAGSAVFLFPQTANAAAALASGALFIPAATVTAKQFIINHPSTATSDRTFAFVCLG